MPHGNQSRRIVLAVGATLFLVGFFATSVYVVRFHFVTAPNNKASAIAGSIIMVVGAIGIIAACQLNHNAATKLDNAMTYCTIAMVASMVVVFLYHLTRSIIRPAEPSPAVLYSGALTASINLFYLVYAIIADARSRKKAP